MSTFSHLVSVEITDVGRRRKNNEDSLLRMPECGVFCVADGMGGVQGGEVASKATVDALREEFTSSPDAPFAVTAQAGGRLVVRALNRASHWIKARSDERGMVGTGSTAVVLVFDRVMPSQALILHAGDSRCYRYRDDKLALLSADHSVAAAAGLPDDKTLPAMFRGVITRAVGIGNTVELEETPVDVEANDLFLLCSDGLNKMVSDKHLHKALRKHREDSLDLMARVLVKEALDAGGEDNVSVILIRVAKTLPEGPTMEVPPETLLLEQLQAASGAEAGGAKKPDGEPETGQTADTGRTVDSAKFGGEGVTPADMARSGGRTPATPVSGVGTTPPTPPSLSTPAPEPDEVDVKTQTVIPETPAQKGAFFWSLAALLVLTCAFAAWFFWLRK